MALGYIASFTERLAMSVIVSHGVAPIAAALKSETDETVRAAAAWSLGQIGRHTPDHAMHVAEANVFHTLVEIHESPTLSEDLQTKVSGLFVWLSKCNHVLINRIAVCLGQACIEECTSKVHTFASVASIALRSSTQCSGTRRCSIFEDSSQRCKSSATICHKWRSQEGTRKVSLVTRCLGHWSYFRVRTYSSDCTLMFSLFELRSSRRFAPIMARF
jgi:hypothetical protein